MKRYSTYPELTSRGVHNASETYLENAKVDLYIHIVELADPLRRTYCRQLPMSHHLIRFML